MVAKITFPNHLISALNYNEKKVRNGHATCLDASGFLREAQDLSFTQKLEVLQSRCALNDRARTKTLHVSLNFHPSEKLSPDTLQKIAFEYMERIGFGAQPYLVYQHQDAGHPHLHIVSTTIRADGSRILTHNLGRIQSSNARKEIEALFNLRKAGGMSELLKPKRDTLLPEAIIYGAVETRESIGAVVSAVYHTYLFTSLAEFNAALRPFNVIADPGKEGERIQRYGGLVYRILNERGEKVGVPIKASRLPSHPTLKNLQEKFAAAARQREGLKAVLTCKLDDCLCKHPSSLLKLMKLLAEKEVFALPRWSAEGRLYGITFVDQEIKCVFKGSDLGKAYAVAGLLGRLPVQNQQHSPTELEGNKPGHTLQKSNGQCIERSIYLLNLPLKNPTLTPILSSNQELPNLPSELLKKKRKKKRKNSSY